MSDDRHPLNHPATRSDPYPVYRRLREEAPVYYSREWSTWVVTRYVDVLALFRDERMSADRASGYGRQLPPALVEKIAPLVRNLGSWALLMDPPRHTRIRALLNKAFTPRLAAEMRPRIERLVGALLEGAAARGELDVVRDLADPLPVTVIGDLMGLDPAHADRLKRWSDAIAAFVGTAPPTLPILEAATEAVRQLEAYFREVVTARRARPGSDLVSELLHAEEAGAILDEQELLSTCAMALFGGHETTTHLIGNALHVLLDREDALARLRDDPSLDDSAIEEMLRFESPVQRMGRVARADVTLHGETIRAGQHVHLMIAAANRDPEQFPEPDRVDLGRSPNRHLAFGMGTHYCVGAALGRLEAAITVGHLVRLFPRLRRLEAEPRWGNNLTIRGLERLPIAVS